MPSIKCMESTCEYCSLLIETDKWPIYDSIGYVHIKQTLLCSTVNIAFVYICKKCINKIASYTDRSIRELLKELILDSKSKSPVTAIGRHIKKCGHENISILPIYKFNKNETEKDEILKWIAATLSENAAKFFHSEERRKAINVLEPINIEIQFGLSTFYAIIREKAIACETFATYSSNSKSENKSTETDSDNQEDAIRVLKDEIKRLKNVIKEQTEKPKLPDYGKPLIHLFDGKNTHNLFVMKTFNERLYMEDTLKSLKRNFSKRSPQKEVEYSETANKHYYHYIY
ncbi:unnamed protein product [Dimorphilus gyrociliatus]|uniref:Uncharacterized protein n=1 Tax=Dimorphilus gyrociliatus TaxID=2664684 RepID=A0A7I8VGR7_9ANNE|nr:unnamed protein product [Dimorphilus gyrociliatus]